MQNNKAESEIHTSHISNANTTKSAILPLVILTAAYAISTLDRSMLAIVADKVKADIGTTDAQIGFLYGTAFAVFYVVFGIPMGKLVDSWSRPKLLSIAMAGWSLFTSLIGLARTYPQIALARIGVGVGEAAVTPASHSLISDYFNKNRRATAMSIYSCGATIGTGLGLYLGTSVMEWWDTTYTLETRPFGLQGWRVAMILAGIPGLILAVVVIMLRDPRNTKSAKDAAYVQISKRPFRDFLGSVATIVPLISLVVLCRQTGKPSGAILRNLLVFAVIAAVVCGLSTVTRDWMQWIVLGVGTYVCITWLQIEFARDTLFRAVWLNGRALPYSLLGFGMLAFASLAFHSWWISFFHRAHPGVEGLGYTLGTIFMVFGSAGMVLGGLIGDKWRSISGKGLLNTCILSGLLTVPLLVSALYVQSVSLSLILVSGAVLFLTLWLPPAAATMQELVHPGMRGLTAALYMLVSNFLGNGLGPYLVGKVSDATQDLGFALASCCGVGFLSAVVLLHVASKHVEKDQTSMVIVDQAVTHTL